MQAAQARKRENSSPVEQMVVKKKMKVCQKKKAEPVVNLDSPVVENGGSEEIKEVISRPKEHANGGGSIEAMDMDIVKVAEEAITEKSAYARVIDTIRTFNTQYLHFVQVTVTCAHKFQVYCILIYLISYSFLPCFLMYSTGRGKEVWWKRRSQERPKN